MTYILYVVHRISSNCKSSTRYFRSEKCKLWR